MSMTKTTDNPRDFDCCAYRTKNDRAACGALRYYHDEVVKRHKFVEPELKLTDAEKVVRLIAVLREELDALNVWTRHDLQPKHLPDLRYGLEISRSKIEAALQQVS